MPLTVVTDHSKYKKFKTASEFINEATKLRLLDNNEAALVLLDKAIKLAPRSDKSYMEKGQMLRILEKFEESQISSQKALEINPDNLFALYNFHRAKDPETNLPETKASMQKIITSQYKTVDDLRAQSIAYLFLKNPDMSKLKTQESADTFPDDAFAQYGWGYKLQTDKRFQEAEVFFRKAVAIDPSFLSARLGLGHAIESQGDVLMEAGKVLDAHKKWQEAEAILEKLYKEYPSYDEALYSLGAVLTGEGKLDQAIKLKKDAIKLDKTSAKKHANLVATLVQKADHYRQDGDDRNAIKTLEEALEYAKKAVGLDPEHVLSQHNLAVSLHLLGRDSEALEAFKKDYDLYQIHQDDQDLSDGNIEAIEERFTKELGPLLLAEMNAFTGAKHTPVDPVTEKDPLDVKFNKKLEAKNKSAKDSLAENKAKISSTTAAIDVSNISSDNVDNLMKADKEVRESMALVNKEMGYLKALHDKRESMDEISYSYYTSFTKALSSSYDLIVKLGMQKIYAVAPKPENLYSTVGEAHTYEYQWCMKNIPQAGYEAPVGGKGYEYISDSRAPSYTTLGSDLYVSVSGSTTYGSIGPQYDAAATYAAPPLYDAASSEMPMAISALRSFLPSFKAAKSLTAAQKDAIVEQSTAKFHKIAPDAGRFDDMVFCLGVTVTADGRMVKRIHDKSVLKKAHKWAKEETKNLEKAEAVFYDVLYPDDAAKLGFHDALFFIKMVTSSGFEANPDTLQHLELVMTGEGAKLPAELGVF